MQLERLIAALAPTDVVGGAAVEIRELAYDAREVPRGALFFCIPGANADGHEFAPAAVAAGAAALVVERPLELEVPQLVAYVHVSPHSCQLRRGSNEGDATV